MAEHLLDQVVGIAESAKKVAPSFPPPVFHPWSVLPMRDDLARHLSF